MAELKRMIEIGIDARPAKAGAAEVDKSMGKVVESTERAKKELERLDKALDSLQKESKGAKSEVDRLDSTIDKLDSSTRQTTTRLDRMEQSLLDVSRNTRHAQIELEKLNSTNTKLASAFDFLKTRVLGLVGGFSALLTIRKVYNDVRDFEAGLIGVAKTTDLSGDALREFGTQIALMSSNLGITQKQLFETAQTAGQLGVRGTDNLLKFTETVAKLGTASDLAGATGATTLARLLNVTGEAVSTVDRLAAVIVALGNQSAATESEIANVAEAVAQASAVFKVSSTDAAAFGATLASFGQEARLAGSTIGRTLRAIDQSIREGGESLEALSKLTGQTAEEFTALFRQDATRGLEAFLRGLKSIINSGGDAAAELEKFGLQGDEVLKVIPALALQVEYLSERIAIARDEAQKGEAANREYAKFAETLKVQMQALGATITSAFTESIKGTLPILTNLVKGTSDLIRIMTGLSPITEETSASVKVLATAIRIATEALLAFVAVKTVAFFTPLVAGIGQAIFSMNAFRAAVVAVVGTTAASGPLVGGLTAASIAVRSLGTAVKGLFASIGPAGWAIIGITAIVELLDVFNLKGDKTVSVLDSMKKGAVDLGDSLDRVKTLLAQMSRGEAIGDLGEQAQALRALANELGNVDIDLTKRIQAGKPGIVEIDALRELIRSGEGRDEIERLRQQLEREASRNGPAAYLENPLVGLSRRREEQNRAAQEAARQYAERTGRPATTGPLNQPNVFAIPATEAIKLLRNEVQRTNSEAKKLQDTIDGIGKAEADAKSLATAESILATTRKQLEEERMLIGATAEFTAQYETRKKLEEEAAKAGVELNQEQVDALVELAGCNVDLANSIEQRKRAQEEALKVARREQEERNEAVQSLNDLVNKAQQETHQLSLTGEARNAYIAQLQVEAIARGKNIDNLDEYISLLEKELNAQDELRKQQEEQRKADEKAKQLAEARSDAEDEISEMFNALEFERRLIGKTNDERERAIELAKLQGLAEVAYAEDLTQATDVLKEYEQKLRELQKQRDLQQLADDIGNTFAETFESIIFDAQSLEDAFESMVRNISRLLFQELVTKQIATNLAQILGGGGTGGAGLLGALFGGGSANGNMFRQGTAVQAFASGGIIEGPSLFPMSGNRVGLAGEKGPEWAIAPLERSPDGKLGAHVKVDQPQQVINVSMVVNTPDADSFNRSSTQTLNKVRRLVSNRR